VKTDVQCQKCRGRASSGSHLCGTCTVDLRRQLLHLPTLVDYLEDAAIGLTKMGEDGGSRRGFESSTPILDFRASDLLEALHSTLGQWATEIARRHSAVISPPVNWHRPVAEYRYRSADYAVFLAAHVDHLASDPDCGDLCATLSAYVKRALVILNRKAPPLFCGPCPTRITDHSRCTDCGQREHECATRLMARRGAVEVVCPACKTTHNVERLINHLLARADDFRATIPELHRVLRMLGTPVTQRTLYRWARTGVLKPAGYLRADNKRIGLARQSDDDKPVYRIADARKQHEQSTTRRRVGRPLKGGKQ